MNSVALVLTDGFEEIEAITIIDILRRAQVKIDIISLNNLDVIGAHQIKIKADRLLSSVKSDDLSMVIFPGGMKNATTLSTNKNVLSLIQEMNQNQKEIAAICAAPMALESAKVLTGKFTCYPGIEEDFKTKEKRLSDRVVSDKNITTSQGPATAMEFSLYLVKKLKGEEVYQKLKKDLLY